METIDTPLVKPERCVMQLRLTKHLYRRIRHAAVRHDRSASAMIRDVMELWLDREDEKDAKRGLPSTFKLAQPVATA